MSLELDGVKRAREDAMTAGTVAVIKALHPGCFDGRSANAAYAAVDAAIPHLLAPIRAFAEELKAADDGSLVTSDYAWIGRRLNALLDQIEAESKR